MRLCTASGADIPRQLSFELIGGGCFGQSGEQVSKVGMGFEAVGFVPRPGKHYLGPRGVNLKFVDFDRFQCARLQRTCATTSLQPSCVRVSTSPGSNVTRSSGPDAFRLCQGRRRSQIDGGSVSPCPSHLRAFSLSSTNRSSTVAVSRRRVHRYGWLLTRGCKVVPVFNTVQRLCEAAT